MGRISNTTRFATHFALTTIVAAVFACLTAAFATGQASPALWTVETRSAVAIGWLIFGGASSIAAGVTAIADADSRWRC